MKKIFVFLAFIILSVIIVNGQITVLPSGYVGINASNPLDRLQINSNFTKIAFGEANFPNFPNQIAYLGFNAVRQTNGTWLSNSNTINNGGSLILSNLDGSLKFISLPSTGASDKTFADSHIYDNVKLQIAPYCHLSVGSDSPLSNCRFFVNSWQNIFYYQGTIGGAKSLYFYINPSDPRIYSGHSSKIVFFGANGAQDIECRNVFQTSDIRLKKNIENLTNSLEKISNLRGVSYNWLQDDNYGKVTTGFIAQEFENVIPELVFTNDTNNYKTINYIGLIPYLVEAIKQQQLIINNQEQKINKLENDIININNNKKANASSVGDESIFNNDNENKLFQNQPNPFSVDTKIAYKIVEQNASAVLYIFDMQGSLKKTIGNLNSGYNEIIINAGGLMPGMYTYSLVVNNKIIDTKKMILTQ